MIYAVGDIHGVLEELERVLGLVRSHASAHGIPRPKVVFLGGAIDCGPDSRAVVERLMGPRLRDEIEPVVLQGNHKAMLVDGATDWSQAELQLHNGGADTIESYGLAIGGKAPWRFLREFYLEALPTEHRTWMAALPLSHRVGGLLFVHAGIHPDRSLDRQRPSDLLWIRHRFLDHPGPYPGKVRVVYGHTPDALVHVGQHRIGLDTGCGSEGPLSAVAIDDGTVTVL